MADLMEEGLGTISKLQPVFIMTMAVAGIVLGQLTFFSDNSGGLIEPFLMILLFIIFLNVDIKGIGQAFKNIKFSAASLAVNFIWTPIIAVVLGYMFLQGSLDMRIGFLMFLVTPCTDWYLVFTGMSKGNVLLGTSILPLNFVIQVLLLPIYLFLYLGTGSSFDMGPIFLSIFIVLVIPFLAANLIKSAIKFKKKEKSLNNILEEHGGNMQLFFLCLAVFVMFASQGDVIVENPAVLLEMLIPLALFFIINFILAQMVGRALKFKFDDTTAFTFTTLARNSPLALAIAVAAFPDAPFIALVLVIGPLIELPVLSLTSAVILRMRCKVKTTKS